MQQKHDLAFTVVSDPGSTLARALGGSPAPPAKDAPPNCNSGST